MKKDELHSETPQINSGVSLLYRGSKTGESKTLSVILGTLMSYAIALMLSFGSLLTFTSMFSVPFDAVIFSVIVAVYTFVMLILFQLPKKIVGFSLLGLLAVLGLCIGLGFNEFSSGFGYIKDKLLVGICESMAWPVPQLSYTFTDAMKIDTTYFLCIVAVPIITGISFFTIRKINFFVGFLLTFPLFEIGAAFGCVPDHICFAVLLAGWTGLFAMYTAAKVKKIRKRKGDKKKTKAAAAGHRQSLVAAIGLLVAVITFGVFLFGNYLVVTGGYDRPENIRELRRDMQESISDFVDYILNRDNDGSLKEGRLYQLDHRIIKDRHYMTVEMPHHQKQTYLKGYVGEDYTGNQWQSLPADSLYQSMLSKYQSTGYYPQNMQGQLLNNMIEKNTIVRQSAGTVTISNLRRKKDYAYLAYIPLVGNSFSFMGDTTVSPSNKASYSYTAFMDDRNFFMMNIADLYYDSSFSAVMKAYTDYVKQEYTKVPTGLGDVAAIVEDLIDGKKYGYKTSAASNLEIADRIRTYLADQITYDLLTPKTPKDQDFVKYLLFESKKGYSAHFATAMAVMLRMAGIPTRYVEGYIAAQEDYDAAEKLGDGYYKLDLTDKNAHAWIEVYETNYGWISIEATPGFYSGSLVGDAGNVEIDSSGQNADVGLVGEDPNEFLEDPDSDNKVLTEPPVELKEEKPSLAEKIKNILLAVLKYSAIFLLSVVVSLAVMLLLLLVFLLARRRLRLSALDSAMASKDRDKRVRAIYRYYNRLLRFEHIENPGQLPYMEYAAYICERSSRLRGEQHLRAMQIFLKYRFSNEPLTDPELRCLERLTVEYRSNSLAGLRGRERFRFRYIENLG